MRYACAMQSGGLTALFVFLFAVVFAWIEIEVEGTEGWAKKLPTAKNVLGHFTLYHVYMILLASLIIIAFMFFKHSQPRCGTDLSPSNTTQQSSPNTPPSLWHRVRPVLDVILKTVFHLVAYFLIQDFLWFVFNPGFKIGGYHPSRVPWHRPWWGGTPAFNFLGVGVLVILLALSSADAELTFSSTAYVGLVLLACLLAPLYHWFYNWIH